MSFYLGPLCAFGSSVTWSVGSTVYSRLSKEYSAFSVNFARALIALPCFILTTFIVSGGMPEGILNYSSVREGQCGWLALSMFASYGIGDACFLWSSRSLGVPAALALASSFPIWTVLAGYLLNGDSLSIRQGLGLLITLLGVVLVILSGPKEAVARSGVKRPLLGVFLGVFASLAWATNAYAVSRGSVDLIPAVGNTVRMIIGIFICACLNAVFLPKTPLLLPRSEVTRFFGVFVFEAFGGSYLYFYGLAHSSLALGAILSSLAPVISVPVTLVLGIEKFSLIKTLGVISVVIGVWFLLGT